MISRFTTRSHRVLGTGVLALAIVLSAPAVNAAPTPTAGPTTGGTSVDVDLPKWSQVFMGEAHSFAIDEAGTLWGWGLQSDYGQLGDGTTIDRPYPVKVSGLVGVEIVDVSLGWFHTLALDAEGRVWVWGDNTFGQLGNGSTVGSETPIQIVGFGGQDVLQIAAGRFRSMAIAADGTVWTWGANDSGELGNGTIVASTTPIQVASAPGRRAVDIQAGYSHSVALADDGTVWVWGANAEGQFGNGTTASSLSPVQVTGLSGRTIVDLSSGASTHTFARDSTGTVWAWGLNSQGQLGDGTTTNRTTPVSIPGLSALSLVDLTAAPTFSLALTTDGEVWAWGANTTGQLADGTLVSRNTPAPSTALTGLNITHMTAGFGDTGMAVDSAGRLWAWGLNQEGQFANGTVTPSATPQRVAPLNATVTFGGRVATSVSGPTATSSTVTAVTPAHPAGAVDVVVTSTFTNGATGPTTTHAGGFTYIGSTSGTNDSGTLAATGDELMPGILVLGVGLALAGLVLVTLSGTHARRRRRQSFVSRR